MALGEYESGGLLAVERSQPEAEQLDRCLKAIGIDAPLVWSAEEALTFLRNRLFDGAIAAVEVRYGAEPLLAALSRLLSPGLVVAIGPSGDWQMERQARLAGVAAYLTRPLSPVALKNALQRCLAEPLAQSPQPSSASRSYPSNSGSHL
jgi:CheY-like chemotaxis protein